MVLKAAGVKQNNYSLWIQDADGLNAFAGGGHIVAVTRKALDELSPPHLSAVLAHELGHHLKGSPWVLLLVEWYALPGKAAVRISMAVLAFVLRVLTFFPLSFLVGLALLVSFAIAVAVLLGPVLLLLFLLAPLGAFFGRLEELQADKIATQLGFSSGSGGSSSRFCRIGWTPAMTSSART